MLEAQADRHFTHLQAFIDRVIWGFGVIGVLLLALLTWFGFSTRRDITDRMHEFATGAGRHYLQELVAADSERTKQSFAEVRDVVNSLKADVNELSAYKRKRVVWIHRGEEPAEAERELLVRAGLHVATVTPEAGAPVDTIGAELLVFTYDGSQEADDLLARLVATLREGLTPVPLLVYARRAELTAAAHAAATTYPWLLPVNFPLTLLATAISLLTGFQFPAAEQPHA